MIYHIPAALAAKGITQSEWEEWTGSKMKTASSGRTSACCEVAVCLAVSSFAPCFIYCMCTQAKAEVEQWNQQLLQWQNDFNAEVLMPKGVFAKSQSKCTVTYGPKGEKQRHAERWFAFSLTPDETQKLQGEPHLTGDIETGCCGGVDERELCIHP